MRGGDRVGDWRLVAPIDVRGHVTRWRAVDAADRPGEVLALAPDASAVARAAFDRAHRPASGEPGLDVVVDHGDVDGFRVVSRTGALSDWPRLGARDDQLRAWLTALVPLVLAAGDRVSGALTPRDLRLDGEAPRLAPVGAADSEDRPFVAPEVPSGGAPDGAAALYGLGVALYRAATGHLPFPAGASAADASMIPVTAWRPDLSAGVAAALARLVDVDPSRRATALAVLVAPPATLVPGQVKVTAAPVEVRAEPPIVDGPLPQAAVVVPGAALRRLAPRQRSVLAGWAGRPDEELKARAERGRAVVIGVARTRGEARRRAAEVRRALDVEVDVHASPGLVSTSLVVIEAVLATIGLALGFATGWTWLVALAAAMFALGLVQSVAWGRAASRFRASMAEAGEEPSARVRSPGLATAWRRLSALRRQLGVLDLPTSADADLREALEEVEQRLVALGRVDDALGAGLVAADRDHLTRRLGASARAARTNTAAAAERDALARALSDLESLERRRADLEEDVDDVRAALDALEAAFPTRDPASRVLDRVEAAAKRTRERLKEPG